MPKIYTGDCLNILPTIEADSVQCVVTSPPYYGLRDYGCDGQIGLESTPEAYVEKLVAVFREVRRVLRDDGVMFLNLGDSYSSHKDCKSIGQTLAKGTSREDAHVMPLGLSRVRDSRMLKREGYKNKDLIGIPWMVAFALRKDGWYLRQDIIWAKPNPMPESVTDRCTKSHEYIFLLTKSARYFYDNEAVKEDSVTDPNSKAAMMFGSANGKNNTSVLAHAADLGHKWDISPTRNRRSVWTITTKPFKEAHFATFPPELPEICIRAGSKVGDTILDPFAGSGTVGQVARNLDRDFILIELNEKYVDMQLNRSVDLFCDPTIIKMAE